MRRLQERNLKTNYIKAYDLPVVYGDRTITLNENGAYYLYLGDDASNWKEVALTIAVESKLAPTLIDGKLCKLCPNITIDNDLISMMGIYNSYEEFIQNSYGLSKNSLTSNNASSSFNFDTGQFVNETDNTMLIDNIVVIVDDYNVIITTNREI